MLSDNSEKSRNPLKKAMRRRNAKTVQFAAPTYVEASDYDYSTEDEEQMIEPYGDATTGEEKAQEEPHAEPEEAQKAEIVHPEAERRSSTGSNRASFDREQAATAAQALTEAGVTGEIKLADKTGESGYDIDYISVPTVSVEAAPLKSKRTRNTDSFLKDETMETRKITLTPGLLREENASIKSPSSDSARSNSFDAITKTSSPTEPQPPTLSKKDAKKKEKEEKPKKSGMLSGLFKTKKRDKKAKDDAPEPDSEKVSSELQRESPRASPLLSGTLSPIDKSAIGPPMAIKNDHQKPSSEDTSRDSSQESSEGFVAELEGSAVAFEMATPDLGDGEAQRKLETQMAQQTQQEKSAFSNPLSPITNMLKPTEKEPKPKKAKRAKERVPMDDFDSPPADVKDDPMEESNNPFGDQQSAERLSESPVEISANTFMHGTESIHIPMPGALPEETDEDDEEPESLTSSPSIIEHPPEPVEDEPDLVEDNDPTPTTRSPQPASGEQANPVSVAPRRGPSTDSSTTSSGSPARLSPKPSPIIAQQTWSDDSLKAWLEDGSDVRDMLVMIHDKSGVKPAPADHPLMSDLFVEQRKGVQNMMGQLDGLLGSYLKRKGVSF